MKKVVLSVMLVVWLVGQAVAGWIVETKENGKTTRTYIDGARVLFEDDDLTSIIDLATGDLIFIDHKQKTIFSGTMTEMKEAVKGTLKKSMDMMQQQMAALPPEQRAAMEKMMGKMMPQKKKTVVPVIKKVGTETISGHKCSKYQILVNGKLQEEIWLAKDVPFLEDIKKAGDLGKLYELQSEFEQMSGDVSYVSSSNYKALVKYQYPMKSREKMASHSNMSNMEQWITTEVISYKKANVSAKFVLPKSYAQKTIKEYFQGQK